MARYVRRMRGGFLFRFAAAWKPERTRVALSGPNNLFGPDNSNHWLRHRLKGIQPRAPQKEERIGLTY